MESGRVGARLAVTRAIGDHNLRRDGVIANPTINRLAIKLTDKWVIIATDGIWDWFKEEDIINITNKDGVLAKNVAEEIVKKALEQGSKDNITCLVIKL